MRAIKSQGEIEAAVCDAVARFQQEFMGRGPRSIHAHLVENRLFVHLEGVLTAAEQRLIEGQGAGQAGAMLPEPWFVVGHPTLFSAGGRVIAWAIGPCEVPATDDALRLCLAIRWSDSDVPPDIPLVSVVVESRATAQRVTFIADAAVEAP